MTHRRRTPIRPDCRAGRLLALALALAAAWTGAAFAQPPGDPRAGGPGIGPLVEGRQDTQDRLIADLVYLRLAASPSLALATFTPAVERRMVTLHGIVPDGPSRERALRIAAWTPGVREVRDMLRVDAASPALRALPEVEDEVLARRIAKRLAELFPTAAAEANWLFGWEVEGNGWEFDVDVDNGEVILAGTVPECRHVRLVVEAARGVPGTRTVRSQLYADGRSGYEFGPYGPYPSLQLPCLHSGPHRPGYGYYGPYPPPPEYGPMEYPSPLAPMPGSAGAPWRPAPPAERGGKAEEESR